MANPKRAAGHPRPPGKKDLRIAPKLEIPPDFYARLQPDWTNIETIPAGLGHIVRAIIGPVWSLRLSIPVMPMSANAMWRRLGKQTIVHPDAKTYRKMMSMAIGNGRDRVAEMVTARFGAVIILESPNWLNQDGSHRISDVDNRIKVVLDAVMKGCGQECDHNCWDVHAFKLPSREKRTTVYLFPRLIPQPSLGDRHG